VAYRISYLSPPSLVVSLGQESSNYIGKMHVLRSDKPCGQQFMVEGLEAADGLLRAANAGGNRAPFQRVNGEKGKKNCGYTDPRPAYPHGGLLIRFIRGCRDLCVAVGIDAALWQSRLDSGTCLADERSLWLVVFHAYHLLPAMIFLSREIRSEPGPQFRLLFLE